jgi:hypothetical protein
MVSNNSIIKLITKTTPTWPFLFMAKWLDTNEYVGCGEVDRALDITAFIVPPWQVNGRFMEFGCVR